MSLTINGSGSALTQNRKKLPRRNRLKISEASDDSLGHSAKDLVDVQPPHGEQVRAQVAALNQAIEANENAQALTGMATEGLGKVCDHLELLQGIATQATEKSRGDPEGKNLEDWFDQVLKDLDDLVEQTRFGERPLLDGSLGCTGMTTGEGLVFVLGTERTRNSGPEGYPVLIREGPARAKASGDLPLRPETIGSGIWLRVSAQGNHAEMTTSRGETPAEVARALESKAREGEVPLQIRAGNDGKLWVQHILYGSLHSFQMESSVPGVLSSLTGAPRTIANGRDVDGTFGLEPATGSGRLLTGLAGNLHTDGLTVMIQENLSGIREGPGSPGDAGFLLGRVVINQNPLVMALGGAEHKLLTVALNSVYSKNLGAETPHGYFSLAEVGLRSPEEAKNGLVVITQAKRRVEETIHRMAYIRQTVLAQNLAELRGRALAMPAMNKGILERNTAYNLAVNLAHTLTQSGQWALVAQEQPMPGTTMKLLAEEVKRDFN